jgi:hypothetical protein
LHSTGDTDSAADRFPIRIAPMTACRIALHWDGRLQAVALHSTTIHALRLEAKQLVRIAEHALSSAIDATTNEPAVVLPFVADDSVPRDAALLPLQYAVLLGWRTGTSVYLSADGTDHASPTAPRPPLPAARRVLAQVWKPGVGLKRVNCAPSESDAGSGTRFKSPVLADLLHEDLVLHPTVRLPGPVAPSAVASSSSASTTSEFRVLHWEGLVCLARIHRLTALRLSESKSAEEDGADEIEEDVSSAIVDEETEVECEVMPNAPVFYAHDPSIAMPASIRPLFPHMLPHTAATDDDTSFAACFPKEWKSLQQFVHNALQSRASSSSAAHSVDPSAAATVRPPGFGFAWSIPRATLIAGMTGVGKSVLLDTFIASVSPRDFIIRRVNGIAMLSQGQQRYCCDCRSKPKRERATHHSLFLIAVCLSSSF